MAGHIFEVLHVHRNTGEIDVRWDRNDDRVITCRVPFDADGNILTDASFKKAIMAQCLDRLEHWDKTDTRHLDPVMAFKGRSFDVTEAYMLRHVDTGPVPATNDALVVIDEFKLEDHV